MPSTDKEIITNANVLNVEDDVSVIIRINRPTSPLIMQCR